MSNYPEGYHVKPAFCYPLCPIRSHVPIATGQATTEANAVCLDDQAILRTHGPVLNGLEERHKSNKCLFNGCSNMFQLSRSLSLCCLWPVIIYLWEDTNSTCADLDLHSVYLTWHQIVTAVRLSLPFRFPPRSLCPGILFLEERDTCMLGWKKKHIFRTKNMDKTWQNMIAIWMSLRVEVLLGGMVDIDIIWYNTDFVPKKCIAPFTFTNHQPGIYVYIKTISRNAAWCRPRWCRPASPPHRPHGGAHWPNPDLRIHRLRMRRLRRPTGSKSIQRGALRVTSL